MFNNLIIYKKTLGISQEFERISLKEKNKPLRKYEEYFYRTYPYENFFLRKKAIQIINLAIEQPKFSKEQKSSGLNYLGMLYSKTKEFKLASDYYNQGRN